MAGKGLKVLIQEIAIRGDEVYSSLVTIDRVDNDTLTCDVTPLDGNAPVYDVKLQAASGDGFCLIPQVGSIGVISFLSKNTAILIQASALEELRAYLGPRSFVITQNDIVFNGGALGGTVILSQLVDNLNSLKKYAEAINSSLPPAFSAIGSGSTSSGPEGARVYNNGMSGQRITLKDMEDKNVKH